MQFFLLTIILIFVAWIQIVLSLSSVLSESINTQCPCIPIPGTTECLPYDSRYQAATINEAIDSFHDLTLDDGDISHNDQKIQDPKCQNKQCQACQNKLKQKLAKVGLLPGTTVPPTLVNATQACTKYKFDDDNKRDDHSNSNESFSEEDDDKSNEKKPKKHHRNRRQASATVPTLNTSVIGTRFSLTCDKKGLATDGSGFMTLCTRCWIWRELPPNYYPRYLNELICDDTDNACLSGYASCSVAHRSAYVVRNDTGVLQVVTLQAGSFCECRIQHSSALATLVMGTSNPTNSITETGIAPGIPASFP